MISNRYKLSGHIIRSIKNNPTSNLVVASFVLLPAISNAADAANNSIILTNATTALTDFLSGPVRRLIDYGLPSAGAMFSMIRGSWYPLGLGALSLGIFELLMLAAGK